MGFVNAKVSLEEVRQGGRRREVELLADTGAPYSIVPEALLRELGVEPVQKLEFELANGSAIERNVGEVRFFYDGRKAVSPVVFGEPGDAAVLGVVTMEALGLEVDPIRKQIRPTRLILY
jgi:predicted aspartyl protease